MQPDGMDNYLNKTLNVRFIPDRYHVVLQENRKIIREIDAELAHD